MYDITGKRHIHHVDFPAFCKYMSKHASRFTLEELFRLFSIPHTEIYGERVIEEVTTKELRKYLNVETFTINYTNNQGNYDEFSGIFNFYQPKEPEETEMTILKQKFPTSQIRVIMGNWQKELRPFVQYLIILQKVKIIGIERTLKST